jgi:hypothetical protein
MPRAWLRPDDSKSGARRPRCCPLAIVNTKHSVGSACYWTPADLCVCVTGNADPTGRRSAKKNGDCEHEEGHDHERDHPGRREHAVVARPRAGDRGIQIGCPGDDLLAHGRRGAQLRGFGVVPRGRDGGRWRARAAGLVCSLIRCTNTCGPARRSGAPKGPRSPNGARSRTRSCTRRGSAGPTRTRAGCCASTSPRAPTFPCTHRSGCSRLRPSSTPDLARHWAESRPQRPCSVYCLTPKGPIVATTA